MDFEASGLGPGSFPIEVGVCRWTEPDDPFLTWSSLISPHPNWLAQGTWAGEAQDLHGIDIDSLQSGLNCTGAVENLNAIVGGHIAFFDGGSHDLNWLGMLRRGSDVQLNLRYGDFNMLISSMSHAQRSRYSDFKSSTPAPHRAGPDARRLMSAIACGLGVEVKTSGG